MSDDMRSTVDFDNLSGELESRFRGWGGSAWSDAEFDHLARRVFAYQHGHCAAYRALCKRRGVSPSALGSWEDAPFVPALAFKHLDLVGVSGEPEAVFRTSGTTRGAHQRGRHSVPRLSLYRTSLLGPFRRHVMPRGGGSRMRFVSLIPSADALPDSSLSYMVSAASEELATEAHWLVDASGRLDVEELRRVAAETCSAGEPVALLGTALSFKHAIDALGATPLEPLAQGSRVMETGGFKGVGGAVSRRELYAGIEATTGVPTARIVNEYGMTELLSQLYEPVLSEGPEAAGAHVPPPWLRVRSLDPTTLAPMPEGEAGVLAFFDLANLGSVSHVLTEDIGSVEDGRVRLRGRSAGAEPRGCSRAMDELMSAAGARR